ncbi:hypothetical protein [Bermanella sp. R86510]|uniref:hypothetical protein n=1 Tax=unclassified Bermanella TaxID=2627862 RepID=UPI0037CBF334
MRCFRLLALLGLTFILSACSVVSYDEQGYSLESITPDTQYQYQPLPFGMQDDPDITSQVIEVEGGRSFYQAYELPPRRSSIVIQLRTYLLDHALQGAGYFYPVVELKDRNQKTVKTIRPQLRFTQLSNKGRYAAVPLEVPQTIAFMVIRTEPKLYGQEASYSTKHEGSSWSYSVSPFNDVKSARYLPAGELEILTPEPGFSRPFEKMMGPFWQLGFTRSEEVLVEASEYVPNLTLGGGPEFEVGYALSIPRRPSSTVRASIGGGYYQLSDNGTHRQHYAKAELMWVESNQVSSIGFGVTSRFAHEYKTPNTTYEFDPSYGPKLLIEIRGAMGTSLGAHISWLDYEDQFGNSYSGTQTGLYFTKLY